ncbi:MULTISPECIES: ribosome biogenesis GTP-binding protein YihA/YsxC [Paenibacillus]|uniref:Probable GTP-binding protein EngB n=2 Tax=Paenibacillus lactis TaxID=228574 RepID=G4HHX0_9BACL|nr:ribosome biogenesis GTP-binding protein YihA/YsxC [Paenibacillus lactis]EHB62943.1 ribosome biogenesis GTP-binding protein YsxC [Paenibacillus lactis 154]MBP1894670.1 GTP-binding protein [Paenibacillus lactis]MCM3495753.1 ribosome biogenesis GTP-binding protein YihA/YsxC [Paenibacillus lactis]GIO94713.1 putative GTP-binding protein EngB [Paenibacillus lactis]HAG00137.1 YihA family ribosome biogenesis GTP-binding protein [Paenibacillus lactis]
MKVTKAEFVISAVGPAQYPEDALPEIALAGRSNVGKSSLINRMISRKNLARTSATPGKTQQLNYYRVNEDLYLVDFPGYGYAKVSKSQRAAFGEMVEKYLLSRDELKLVLLVVDMRHPPTKDDVSMYEWLQHYDRPVCVVATKADKIPKTRRQKHVKIVKETLGFQPHHSFVMFSSELGLGKEELWEIIESHIGYRQENGEGDNGDFRDAAVEEDE